MSFSPKAIISKGYERTQTRAGWLLIAAYLVVYLVNTIATQSMAKFETVGESSFVDLGVPGQLGILPSMSLSYLVFFISLGLLAVFIVLAIRVFYRGHEDTIPPSVYHGGLKRDVLWLSVAMTIAIIGVGLGLLAFIVPGIYLLVALFYFPVFLIEHNHSMIESFRASSNLVEGYKWDVLRLGIRFLVTGTIFIFLLGIVGRIIGAIWPAGFEIVIGLAISFVGVWMWAATVEAYRRLEELQSY